MIDTDLTPPIATLTLNRPEKRNALTRESIERMHAFVQDVADRSEIRLLIVQSKGPVFCAGMDLAEMQSRATADDPEAEWQKDSDVYCDLVASLFELRIPTLCIMQGPVLAGGTGLVFACDLVVASESAFFQLPEPARGITAAMVCPLLIYRSSVAAASHLLLSGQRIPAERACQQHLVQEVVDADQLADCKQKWIESILTGSPDALAITKSHLKQMSSIDVAKQLRNSAAVSAKARRTDDAREGLDAFLEKRKPKWQAWQD